MHIILRGTTLVFITKLTCLRFGSFLTNISKIVQKMSKISSQKCHGRWFGGSTWRSTGLNESVWSPGTPMGFPGAVWGPGGPNNVFVLVLALSWANRRAHQGTPLGPPTPKTRKPPFWAPWVPRKPPGESLGTIRTHSDPWISTWTHQTTSHGIFEKFV